MKNTLFKSLAPRPEPRLVLWVKRVCIAVLSVQMVFSCWSMYRRIWQVLRIEVTASSTAITAGATVSYDVITSGEVHNRILLELVQSTHAETLHQERAQVNAMMVFDPRVFRYTRTIILTPEILNRFVSGPATLRLTGFGGRSSFARHGHA